MPRLGLRMGTKLSFGIGSAAEAAILVAFNSFNFLFYNNVLGLSGTLCGLAVTVALVVDAVADPVVGALSDRTRSRLGRRHPFLYAAPVPLALAFYFLYTPPASLTGLGLFAWFTGWGILQRLFMSLYHGPHLALGAELTRDYRERSIVMSYNVVFWVVGGSLAFFFGWTWFSRVPGGTMAREAYGPMAAGVGLFSALAILASAYFTRDQIARLPVAPAEQEPFSLGRVFRELSSCLQNRDYAALLLGMLTLSVSLGVRETLASYVGLFFWKLPATSIRAFALASPIAFVLAFIGTSRLHARFDKRATLIGAAALMAFTLLVPIPLKVLGLLPPDGSRALMAVLLVSFSLSQLGFAVLNISVLSALADVADAHDLATGKRQEGIFFAARSFAWKASSGFGHLVAGFAVDVIGFPTSAQPGSVPERLSMELALFEGPIAALPALFAVSFFARYGIDRRRHTEIQRALAERRSVGAWKASELPARGHDALPESAAQTVAST